jgi:hypothetical protein
MSERNNINQRSLDNGSVFALAATKARNLLKEASGLESSLRGMFASCTSGANANVVATSDELELELEEATVNSHPPEKVGCKNAAFKKRENQLGDDIYAQLFYDDQKLAKVTAKPNKRTVPSPRQSFQPNAFVTPSPKHHQHSYLDPHASFDDTISAISAHTLEAMARTPPHEHKELILGARPLALDRIESKEGRSISTRTTESSSFDHWQKEETKYWSSHTKEPVAMVHVNVGRPQRPPFSNEECEI